MSKYSYKRILETVPSHLQPYVRVQNYDRYSDQDQAVWRYIMRKNINFLSRHAHPSYLKGLEKTGISLERIPNVEIMNERLDKLGWRAVIVDGFIPPAAFMEFQAHKILVISAEIRTINHILYTPAPDIVHEAAGHAPIIADSLYAKFLQKFGEYGSKAIASKMDFTVYEAIRHLSIMKEYPDATAHQIRQAEADLDYKIKLNNIPSEASLLSRLHWWTVEYGLVGTPKNFKQYGAGLLSSVGESQHCLNPNVTKIALSINCADYNYDITNMQPQLFVAEDWHHLLDVLEEFASKMCFRKGDLEALEKVIESENVSTIELSSGLQISGILSNVETGDRTEAIYIQFSGPSALADKFKQIPGHGTDYHKDGFGSPIGKLYDSDKALEYFNVEELSNYNIVTGKKTKLEFKSGIAVEGEITNIIRNKKMVQLIRFKNCLVKDKKGKVYFQPEWGIYDMAVGEKITSVFAGTADKENFNIFPPKSEELAIEINYSKEKKHLFTLYQKIREMRENDSKDIARLSAIQKEISLNYSKDWLIHLELLELVKELPEGAEMLMVSLSHLKNLKNHSEEYRNLITDGLTLLKV